MCDVHYDFNSFSVNMRKLYVIYVIHYTRVRCNHYFSKISF